LAEMLASQIGDLDAKTLRESLDQMYREALY
jgi:hypothetical protein